MRKSWGSRNSLSGPFGEEVRRAANASEDAIAPLLHATEECRSPAITSHSGDLHSAGAIRKELEPLVISRDIRAR